MTAAPDLDGVAAWMAQHVDGFKGPLVAEKFATGQSNPTYLLSAPSGRYVLRRKPSGVLLKSAHAVDREFRVQRALEPTDVPVPAMHALCTDDSVIGSMFYVMEHVEGRHFGQPDLVTSDAPERAAIYDEMNRVLAAVHDVDINTVGLADFGPPGNYFERQIGRWAKQYEVTKTDALPEMGHLIHALTARIPPDDGQRTLVHGDFRIDNLIFDAETSHIRAVLDWELSTIGHPYADLAALIMQWRLPPGAEGRGLAGLDRASLGIPSDGAFVDQYCTRRGIGEIPDFGFYVAFCFFRMAAVLQGVKKRALEGNASNPDQALRLGGFVPNFIAQGLQEIGG